MTVFDNIHEPGASAEEDSKIGKPYKAPMYISYIRSVMRDKYPNTVPKAWMVEAIIRAYMSWFEESLMAHNGVDMYGYGKILSECRVSRQTKKDQWYLKMYPSRHLLLRLREYKGTLTKAEQKEIDAKQAYADARREKRDLQRAGVREAKDPVDNSKQIQMQTDLAEILEANDGGLPSGFDLQGFYQKYA